MMKRINQALRWLLNPNTYGPTSFITKLIMFVTVLTVILIQLGFSAIIAIIRREETSSLYLHITWTSFFCVFFVLLKPVARWLLKMREITDEILNFTLAIQSSLQTYTQLTQRIRRRVWAMCYFMVFLFVCIAVIVLMSAQPSELTSYYQDLMGWFTPRIRG